MAKINPCPEPVRRTGGAAPKCIACSQSEDFCYRLPTDTATVQRAGKYTYDIDEMCVRTNEVWSGDDGAPLEPCSVTKLLCGGGGGGSGVPPEPVPPTDRELIKRCDPDTGAEILFMWDVTVVPPALLSATDLTTGAPYAGDGTELVSCGGAGYESDPQIFCDGTNNFLRWFVKKDGKPTGVTYDTDLSGVDYVPVGPVAPGECKDSVTCTPTISSAFGDDLSALLPGNSIAIQKPGCCAIKVTTSAGDFLVRKGMVAYSTTDFNCPVTVTGVEVVDGTCEIAEVIVTTQAKG